MAKLILFNKPHGVLSQFTDADNRRTLADYLQEKDVYPAGRLDRDSEGLLLLTDSGALQHWIAGASRKKRGLNQAKHYWVQVEGQPSPAHLSQLRRGIELKDGRTLPAQVELIKEPRLWARHPPVRQRLTKSTHWLNLVIREGRNRQVRRMTAAIGHPTLRLIRHQIAHWKLGDLQPGEHFCSSVHLPESD